MNLNTIQIYAPTSTSSDEDIKFFYENLEQAKAQCRRHDSLIIMGDFNAEIGKGKGKYVTGSHGFGIRNIRGEKLIVRCHTNNIIIGNTWFEPQKRRNRTCKSLGDRSRNQVDYILISKRFRNALLSATTYLGADC